MNRLGSLVALACGTTGLVFSGFTPSRTEKGAADRFGPQLAKAYTALFNDPALVKKGVFGVARDPLANTHLREDNEPLFSTQLKVRSLIDQIKVAGLDLEEGLFAPQGGQARPDRRSKDAQYSMPPLYKTSWKSANLMKHRGLLFGFKALSQRGGDVDLEQFAVDTFARAKTRPFVSKREDYQLYSFPVKFEHKECLSCHPRAKLNATAAVLTFAFKKA